MECGEVAHHLPGVYVTDMLGRTGYVVWQTKYLFYIFKKLTV